MKNITKLLKNLWITFRPHFFFVSGAAGLCGMALAYADPPLWKAVTTFVICFFSYGLIQALCDTFDLETDRINAPFRPMVSGELPVRTVIIIISGMLMIVGVMFYLINPILLAVEAVALIFSFTYNRMKRIPHAGPLWNGVIVATLPYVGGFGVSEARTFTELPFIVHLNAFIVGLVYAGFVLTGYFKDVTGDSQTGYRTAPVTYGIQTARWHVLPYTVVAVFGIALYSLSGFEVWDSAPIAARMIFLTMGTAAIALLVLSNFILILDPSERNSYGALLWYTRGMVLFFLSPLALILSVTAIPVAGVFLASMEYFLSKTRETSQA